VPPATPSSAFGASPAGPVRRTAPWPRLAGAFDSSIWETTESAREQLLAVEAVLRDLWADVVETSPVLAARLNTAARLARNAAAALDGGVIA
jgi:hypothetical protein